METHLRTDLVFTALEMAIGQRKPHNVIHHSDRGSQYTALAFGGCCREAGISAACPAILSGNGERLPWCRLPHRLTGAASNGILAVFEWGFHPPVVLLLFVFVRLLLERDEA